VPGAGQHHVLVEEVVDGAGDSHLALGDDDEMVADALDVGE